MRLGFLLPLVFLALAGCIDVHTHPNPPATATVVTPAPSTTYVEPAPATVVHTP